MSVEIRTEDVDAFLAVPRLAYGPASPYVAPLDGDLRRALDARANPLFGAAGQGVRRVLTAHRDGRPVLRVVAHVHGASNARFGERRGSFGFLDGADDLEAARALFGAAEAFVREEGCDTMVGNFNLTAMQQMGVLTDGFDATPYSDMVWNPPHIPRLLEALGYRAEFPVRTFELDVRGCDPEAALSPAARARLGDPALRWEVLRPRDLGRILERIRAVLNDGFARNPMFVPLTAEEMRFQAADLSHVLDPAITALVSDAEGPVGVVLAIPDLNPLFRAMGSRLTWTAPWHLLRFRLRRRRAVVVFYGVAARWQGRGVNGAMLHRVLAALRRRGYESLGLTWIADVNGASLRQVERLGARPLHRLHLYRRNLP